MKAWVVSMTTADWALVISICSAFVAMLSFIWNVWSKFIYPKPKLVVSFTLKRIMDDKGWHDSFLNLSVTNHGPVACTLTHSFVQVHNGLFRKPRIGLINPLSNFPNDFETARGPFSGGLPKKIEVGEEFSLQYWYGENWLDENVLNVGVFDSFNRKHVCFRTNVRQVQKTYLKDKAAGKLAKDKPR
jgi:hypothetical protein